MIQLAYLIGTDNVEEHSDRLFHPLVVEDVKGDLLLDRSELVPLFSAEQQLGPERACCRP
jgi:hypothetical protein